MEHTQTPCTIPSVALSHPPQTRLFWLDVARALAIVSITTNHALNRTWSMNSGSVEELHTISLFSTLLTTDLSIAGRKTAYEI